MALSEDPTTVVVHCGHLPAGPRLERRLRSVVKTLPDQVRVIATVVRKTSITRSLAQRVDVELITDGGDELFARLFGVDALFVVLPPEAQVEKGWFEEVQVRARRDPDVLGVVRCGAAHVFVCPSRTTSLESRRALWEDVPGLSAHEETRSAGAEPSRRSLSAVLIAKDEERVLDACLSALAPFVDEVVVYDTGSTDATRDIARTAGARVVEGYWDDDFGAARNRALTHVTTDWALSVDADEVVEGDVEGLRAWVDSTRATHALINIVSTSFESGEDGIESRTVRLFQRLGARWSGSLHEQLGFTDDHTERLAPDLPPVRLVHSGYTAVAFERKKGRNTRIARTALDKLSASDAAKPDLICHLVRSLISSGEVDEGLRLAEELPTSGPAAGNLIQVCRVLVPIFLGRSDSAAARRWTTVARDTGESPGQCTVWEAAAASVDGDLTTAWTLLTDLTTRGEEAGGRDYWFAPFDDIGAHSALAEVDHHRGDHEAAAARIVDVLRRRPEVVNLQALLGVLAAAGWSTGDLIRVAPEAFLERTLREVVVMDPAAALRWFAAMVQVRPDDHRPVVAGCLVASRRGWRDAVEWEMHARDRGLAGVTPLLDLAADTGMSHVDRAMAYALVLEGFGDDSALAGLRSLLATAPSSQHEQISAALEKHVPAVIDRLLEEPAPAC